MSDTNSWIQKLIEWSNTLYGLPILPLLFIGCIAAGYAIKLVPIFPNRWAPISVVVFGVSGALATTPLTGKSEFFRAIIYGLVVGVGAIAAHRKFLKSWIDEKTLKGPDDDEAGG